MARMQIWQNSECLTRYMVAECRHSRVCRQQHVRGLVKSVECSQMNVRATASRQHYAVSSVYAGRAETEIKSVVCAGSTGGRSDRIVAEQKSARND